MDTYQQNGVRDEDAVKAFDVMCEKRGLPVNAKVKNHVCSRSCSMWHFSGDIFVCKWSRAVHRCGASCAYAEITKSRECYTCPLTGFVIKNMEIEMHYVRRNPNMFSSHKLLGDNRYVVPTKKKRVPRRLPLERETVETFIREISNGSIRHRDYNSALQRYAVSIKPIIVAVHQPMVIAIARCIERFEAAPRLLRFPPCKIDDRDQQRLAVAICAYWEQIKLPVPRSTRTTIAFAAAIVGKMRTGIRIKGVQVIPYVSWLLHSTPPDTNFSGVMDLKCRAVSALWRKIMDKVICSETGMPIRELCFPTIPL